MALLFRLPLSARQTAQELGSYSPVFRLSCYKNIVAPLNKLIKILLLHIGKWFFYFSDHQYMNIAVNRLIKC